MITLTSVTLPVASYSKFKPQQVDFLNITNPKAVLEKHLRSFACLSKNDMISIDYLGKEYELQIVETKDHYQSAHRSRRPDLAVAGIQINLIFNIDIANFEKSILILILLGQYIAQNCSINFR